MFMIDTSKQTAVWAVGSLYWSAGN